VRAVLRLIGLSILVVAFGSSAVGDEPLNARVIPRTGFAPAEIMIQAFIEPNALNRSVSVVVESESFYGSSVTPLAGDRAPRLNEVRFHMLPAGLYDVRVTLFGGDGERGSFASSFEVR
jgi:hypothetical protein